MVWVALTREMLLVLNTAVEAVGLAMPTLALAVLGMAVVPFSVQGEEAAAVLE